MQAKIRLASNKTGICLSLTTQRHHSAPVKQHYLCQAYFMYYNREQLSCWAVQIPWMVLHNPPCAIITSK